MAATPASGSSSGSPRSATTAPGPAKRGRIAWALAILAIAGYAVVGMVGLVTSGHEQVDPVTTVMFGAAVSAFSLMGALLIHRVPANRIGVVLLATGTSQAAGIAVLMYASIGGSTVPPLPGAAAASVLIELAYIAPFVIALIGIPLVFPDGRLPSPRFRWVVAITGAGLALQVLAGLVPWVPGLAEPDVVIGVFNLVSVGFLIFAFGGAVTAVWVTFRRGNPVQRQQVKWLLAVAAVAAIAFPVALILGPSEALIAIAMWVIGFLAYLALPVAIGVAVLRYRLYDIDRIISRTIGYLVVTGLLALVFASVVLVLQEVLATLAGGSTLAVAASTLVVAALFQPVRRRVQAAVDRRFNRARYDADRTVAALAARLREVIDLETIGLDVVDVIVQSVAPSTVRLWIRDTKIGG